MEDYYAMAQHKQTPPLPAGLDEQTPEELHPALQFLLENIKPIGIGIISAILVVAAITGYRYYQKNKMLEASQELGRIVLKTHGQERIKALETFVPTAPEAVKPSALFSLADEAMNAGDYKTAAKAYKQLASLGDASTNLVAIMGQATAEMGAGNPGEAASLLSKLKAEAPENFTVMIDMQLAQAYEQAGQYQAAIDAYQNVLAKAGPDTKALFEYKIAKLKAKIGQSNTSAS